MGRRALHEYTLATREFLFDSLKEAIRNAYPDHKITQDPNQLSEESSTTWLLQPLDGETNFLRSLQNYCAVIGIYEGRVLQHSIVYDYLQDEEYYATRDDTAMINQNRLRVSRIEAMTDAVIAYSEPNEFSSVYEGLSNRLDAIVGGSCKHLRITGSLGMDIALVARGRLDALFAPANPQDLVLLSTSILITEAGGYITNISNREGTGSIVVAANPKLNQSISSLLNKYLDRSDPLENSQSIGLD